MSWQTRPCQACPDRFAGISVDDPAARQMCVLCPFRRVCAEVALDLIERKRPCDGIWAGVWLPVAEEVRKRTRFRGHQVEKLRSVAATLRRFEEAQDAHALAG